MEKGKFQSFENEKFENINLSGIPEDIIEDFNMSRSGVLDQSIMNLPIDDPKIIRHPDGTATYSVRINQADRNGSLIFSLTYVGTTIGGKIACSGEIYFLPQQTPNFPYVGGIRVRSIYDPDKSQYESTVRRGLAERLYPILNKLAVENHRQTLHSGDANEAARKLWKKLVDRGLAEPNPGYAETDMYAFRFKS